MAVQLSLPALLDTLTSSLTSAHEATPKLASLAGGATPDGVSLLDVKNELLLSYLQNLVFLILLKIRRARRHGQRDQGDEDDNDDDDDKNLSDTVVEKLVELRLYLENGVRPLEEKLRFQLDKILRAADDADRSAEMSKQQADADAAAIKLARLLLVDAQRHQRRVRVAALMGVVVRRRVRRRRVRQRVVEAAAAAAGGG